MNGKLKKILAAALAVCMAALVCVPAFAGLTGDYSAPIPTVYLHGQGGYIYADKDDPKSEMIQDISVPDGYIEDLGKALIGPLAKGMFLNQWDDWVDTFVDGVAPLLEKQALDENGEASNGSGVYTSSGNYKRVQADGSYKLDAYTPAYDWRLDPYVIAEEIHTYIGQIREATGCDKVNLIGRSIGSSVEMAYLELYGSEWLDTIVLYCPSFYGMETISKTFAGKIEIDPDGIENFSEYYVASGAADELVDGDTLQLLLDVVNVTVSLRMLDIPSGMMERIYSHIYGEVYPRLLVKAYGSMPSFWSLVGDDDYEEAKALMFGGQEDVYAGLIEKIDHFHYSNLVRSEEILSALAEEGAKLQIVAKYGVPMIPLVEGSDCQSDMLTSVYSATLGAESAGYGKALSDKYIAARKAEGKDQYIGADREVDASTAFLPDHTWFIKNLAHRTMPDSINYLFEHILNYDGYITVFDDEEIPQYLWYDAEESTVTPLTADSGKTNGTRNFFQRVINIYRYIFNYLRKLLRRDRNAD